MKEYADLQLLEKYTNCDLRETFVIFVILVVKKRLTTKEK